MVYIKSGRLFTWAIPVPNSIASAEFRQRLYQKALNLLQNKQLQEDFSPSAERTRSQVEE
jgi:hypothetical protein